MRTANKTGGITMRRMIVVLSIVTSVCQADLEEAAPLYFLRVARIGTNFFDYVFTCYADALPDGPVLFFNHSSGRTFFGRIGERIGHFRIEKFAPRVERAFNSSVNTWLESKGGSVFLTGENGWSVELELGKIRPLDGWHARLVSLRSLEQWLVREGDGILVEGMPVRVARVSEGGVSVCAEGREATLAFLSEEEAARMRIERERRELEVTAATTGQERREAFFAPPGEDVIREVVEQEEAAPWAAVVVKYERVEVRPCVALLGWRRYSPQVVFFSPPSRLERSGCSSPRPSAVKTAPDKSSSLRRKPLPGSIAPFPSTELVPYPASPLIPFPGSRFVFDR